MDGYKCSFDVLRTIARCRGGRWHCGIDDREIVVVDPVQTLSEREGERASACVDRVELRTEALQTLVRDHVVTCNDDVTGLQSCIATERTCKQILTHLHEEQRLWTRNPGWRFQESVAMPARGSGAIRR